MIYAEIEELRIIRGIVVKMKGSVCVQYEIPVSPGCLGYITAPCITDPIPKNFNFEWTSLELKIIDPENTTLLDEGSLNRIDYAITNLSVKIGEELITNDARLTSSRFYLPQPIKYIIDIDIDKKYKKYSDDNTTLFNILNLRSR